MQEKIYKKSPYFLKCLLVNIKAFVNKKERYNKYYKYSLEELISNYESFDNEVILSYQKDKLVKLLLECFDYSDYYKNIFKAIGITKENIKSNPYEVLKSLPILEKQVLREKTENILNKNPERKISNVNLTSGTTGTPTKTYYDFESEAISFALWNRFHKMIGLEKSDKHVRLSYKQVVNLDREKPPFWIYNFVDNQLLMSVYHLNEKKIQIYVDKLQKFKPLYIDGSPSAIHILAEFILRKGISLNFDLKGICTTAETLFDHQRADIEKAFSCKVYNQYASSEGSPFITECTHGKMHINEDSGIFEILDSNNCDVNSGIGRLVVTSFRSWKTPLIRYDIGDFVEVSINSKCECNSPFKIVEKVLGRSNDLFWINTKGYVRARVSSCLGQIDGIKEIQIIQKKPTVVIVKMVVDRMKYLMESEGIIMQNLKDSLEDNITVDFEYLTKFEYSKHGKFKFIVREFNVNDYISSNG